MISGEVRAVARFVEKPDAVKAADYVESGYLWNSGNFMFPAAMLLDEYRKVDAASVRGGRQCRRQRRPRSRLRDARAGGVRRGEGDLDRLRGDGEDLAGRRGAGVLRLVRCRLLARGVGVVGEGHARQCRARRCACSRTSRNCNVTTDAALVALEGVDDLVVVATADAVLVSRQKDANGLKRLVTKLKAVAPKVTEEHLKVHRPWGCYQSRRQWRAPPGQAHRR